MRVHLPEALADLWEDVSTDPEEVHFEPHFYSKIHPTHLRSVCAREEILLANVKELARSKTFRELDQGSSVTGRIIMITPSDQPLNAELPNHYAIDVLGIDAIKRLLRFKLLRAVREMRHQRGVLKAHRDVVVLNEIGSALSTEKSLQSLMELIVSKSREVTCADAGSLYLVEAIPGVAERQKDYFANKRMRFAVAQNESREVPFRSFLVDVNRKSIYGYAGVMQQALNFVDVYYLPTNKEYSWGGRPFDTSISYRTKSMLTVPLINWRGETIGIIQLINRKPNREMRLETPAFCEKHVQPFSEDDLRLAQSIASQASIAIQNAELVESVEGLFRGFIDASVNAIESRDPTTSGHSRRVAKMTVGLAERTDAIQFGRFRNLSFNVEQINEIRYASLLHDFGKIGVHEHVLVKEEKLYPEELGLLRARFRLARSNIVLEHTRLQFQQMLSSKRTKSRLVAEETERMSQRLEEMDEILQFIEQCNKPTVLPEGNFNRLHDIAKNHFLGLDGEKVPLLKEHELESLSVKRGSLTAQDRKEIESHVTHTYQFLCKIPWTTGLRRVPEIAHAHHEKLNGTGYPNQLKEDEIPIESKMMTISDIYDALTAQDRPYKKALSVERALSILSEEAKSHNVDNDLLEIFISQEIYRLSE